MERVQAVRRAWVHRCFISRPQSSFGNSLTLITSWKALESKPHVMCHTSMTSYVMFWPRCWDKTMICSVSRTARVVKRGSSWRFISSGTKHLDAPNKSKSLIDLHGSTAQDTPVQRTTPSFTFRLTTKILMNPVTKRSYRLSLLSSFTILFQFSDLMHMFK